MNEDFLMTISPFVRRARIMQTENLSGRWMDYDHCVTGIIDGEADFVIQDTKYHLVKAILLLFLLCANTRSYPQQRLHFCNIFFILISFIINQGLIFQR